MLLKLWLMTACCCCTVGALSQQWLKGQVFDALNKKPVIAASVFLNNTSTGTKTDEQGRFELLVPAGRFELVVSSIGFQTFLKQIGTEVFTEYMIIELKQKTTEMETIVVESYEKDGWEKWGKFFTEQFIGTSAFSNECTIKNRDVMRFRLSREKKELTAIALEPLVVENKALGYTVRYQLENFVFHFDTRVLSFTGFPFFEPMQGNASKQRRWERNRQNAYYGSLLHFMRSVYRNKVQEEGFEVRKVKRMINTEKSRVRQVYSQHMKEAQRLDGAMKQMDRDSSSYYQKILKQRDYMEIIGKELLPGDSIAYGVSKTVAGLDFPDYLMVTYSMKMAPREYMQRFVDSSPYMQSQLTLINGRPIEIYYNGMFYNPEDLLSLGYWAWSEKLSSMLPFDYVP